MTDRRVDTRMLFYILALIVAYCIAKIAQQLPDLDFQFSGHANAQVAFSYRDLPSSDHAKTGHLRDLYNAGIIADMFDNKDCEPQIDLCEGDKEIHWCEIRPGFSIALVIGKTVRQIITGYGASTNYWENRCPQT